MRTTNFTFTFHIFTKEIFRPRDKLSFGHREAREGDLTSGDYRFKNSKTFNVQPTFGESLPLSRLSKIQLIDLSLFTAYVLQEKMPKQPLSWFQLHPLGCLLNCDLTFICPSKCLYFGHKLLH